MSGHSLRTDGPAGQVRHAGAAWDLRLACRLVNHAARQVPPGLRDRLEEEWLADLAARTGAFARLRFGLGCCWATRVIAREFGAAAAAAGNWPSGQRLLVAHAGYDFSRFSRRTVALIAIVCLHIGIFYIYLTGFTGIRIVDRADPLKGIVIVKHDRPHLPTPLPLPELAQTSLDPVPLPAPRFKLPEDPKTITVAHAIQPQVPSTQPVASPPVERVIGGPGTGFPDTEDYYPPAARRLGEAGSTVVSVCVDLRGRLTAAPAIVESSGIRLIDEGALRLAGAGSGHYRPTTENGQPVSSCYAFRIRFQLQDP
jgi:TonB family protein